MTEHGLSIKLRIRLIERFTDVDLPAFLFEQLDQLMSEVTYYKLTNLEDNIDAFITYLQWVADSYYDQITTIEESNPNIHYATHIYASYFTDKLYSEQRKPTCWLKDLLKVKQRFLVMTTLMSKEFMYRKQNKSLLSPLERFVVDPLPQ